VSSLLNLLELTDGVVIPPCLGALVDLPVVNVKVASPTPDAEASLNCRWQIKYT
jgi:hypothetical protein